MIRLWYDRSLAWILARDIGIWLLRQNLIQNGFLFYNIYWIRPKLFNNNVLSLYLRGNLVAPQCHEKSRVFVVQCVEILWNIPKIPFKCIYLSSQLLQVLRQSVPRHNGNLQNGVTIKSLDLTRWRDFLTHSVLIRPLKILRGELYSESTTLLPFSAAAIAPRSHDVNFICDKRSPSTQPSIYCYALSSRSCQRQPCGDFCTIWVFVIEAWPHPDASWTILSFFAQESSSETNSGFFHHHRTN